jgi:hypothetical protein
MTTTDEKIDELARQVEAMTVALERLYALLSERPADGGKRRVKPSPAQLAELQKTTAYKARVAQAAMRDGVPPPSGSSASGPSTSSRPACHGPPRPYEGIEPPR